jgi:hypothetical protein
MEQTAILENRITQSKAQPESYCSTPYGVSVEQGSTQIHNK